MRAKFSPKPTTKSIIAIKVLINPEDIDKARQLAISNGMKIQNYFGNAIRKAVQDNFNGYCE